MEAARLAARLLTDHAREGKFEVRIDEAHDIERVALRLREAGCVVEINRIKRVLDVDCPQKE